MLGTIVGDIVGSVYEFSNIKKKDFELFKPRCRFTDDMKEKAYAYLDEPLKDVLRRWKKYIRGE